MASLRSRPCGWCSLNVRKFSPFTSLILFWNFISLVNLGYHFCLMVCLLTASPRLRRTMHMLDYIYTVNQFFRPASPLCSNGRRRLTTTPLLIHMLLYNLDENLCPVGGRTTVRVRQVKMLLSDCLTCCRTLLPWRRTNFVAAHSLRHPSFSVSTHGTQDFWVLAVDDISLPLLSSHKWVWLTVMFPACWEHVLDKIRTKPCFAPFV